MSRVINTASPGKERNQLRRTIAEVLRHLMFKRTFDEETKDMAAAVVIALRGIVESVEVTTAAWEKRDYYLKADKFRLEWEWAAPAADRLCEVVRQGQWDRLPQELAALAPHFGDVRIVKMTRPASTWASSYQELLSGE
ncbi:MAG: hypothetical protein ACYC4R_07010 [Anaerolineae bacterium]